jgi:hypothetical protein
LGGGIKMLIIKILFMVFVVFSSVMRFTNALLKDHQPLEALWYGAEIIVEAFVVKYFM